MGQELETKKLPEKTFVTMEDGFSLATYRWAQSAEAGPPSAVVQIVHGMEEHAQRYQTLANFLLDRGIEVWASDTRGHGHSKGEGPLGYFGPEKGWESVVNDQKELAQVIREKVGPVPRYLLGHSLGSFVTLNYLIKHGEDLAGAILTGPSYIPRPLILFIKAVGRLEKMRVGATGFSRIFGLISFEKYNRQFRPNRTPFDWLSRDWKEVDKYIADPFCGHGTTVGACLDIARGLDFLFRPANLAKIPPHLPLLLMAGQLDPVSQGKGVAQLVRHLSLAGVEDITVKVYPKARHEILNETNAEVVREDISHWILDKLSQSAH